MSEAKKSGITYKSCFKTLLVKFLQAEGNMAQMPAKYRSSIKCFVKESQPHFLITDGHFFIAGHFTKEAIDSFKAKYKSHHMESLKGFLINIERWTLELALVDSTKAFTSYANLEFRLVIHSFSLAAPPSKSSRTSTPKTCSATMTAAPISRNSSTTNSKQSSKARHRLWSLDQRAPCAWTRRAPMRTSSVTTSS